MTKFKVGDKVRIIKDMGGIAGVKIGTVTTVTEVDSGGDVRVDVINKNGVPAFFLAREVELVSPKPTKNQRLTMLEKEVETLKAEMAALKDAQSVGKTAEAIARAIEKHSPNEQRKAIIDEAKAFVEDDKDATGGCTCRKGYYHELWCIHDAKFEVNAEKRTVVCLLKPQMGSARPTTKAIAKCAPDDVFNADIGKAIALGRALGLDVSKFEKAVKPSEVVAGMVVEIAGPAGGTYEIKGTDGNKLYIHDISDGAYFTREYGEILDDSEAKY